MLRWHYRSRHHSLIAVSNREFYERPALRRPQPDDAWRPAWAPFPARQGRRLRPRRQRATNRVEARAVAEAVIEHARQIARRSRWASAAFSVAQRDAIRDELEAPSARAPATEAFFSLGRPSRSSSRTWRTSRATSGT